MCCHARRFFFVYFEVLIVLLFPLAATAQTGDGQSSAGKTVAGDLSTQVSDETFLSIMKARDDKLAFVAELKQIRSYHDKLKSGLENLFSLLPINSREAYNKAIDDELDRIKQLETDIGNEHDDRAKNRPSEKI